MGKRSLLKAFSFIMNNRGKVNAGTLPEADELEAGQELSKEQRESIEEFKNEDWDAAPEDKHEGETPEEKEIREKAEEEARNKEEEDAKPKDDETPEEKADREKAEAESKKEGEAEAKETERLEKKATKLDKTVEEVKKLESDEKGEKDRVEAVAKEDGITVDEVKENETKDKSLAERHSNDPVKVARALRKEQSEYGKLKNEVEGLNDYKAQSEAQRSKISDQQIDEYFESKRDDIIDKYREKRPESEDMSDDTIMEKAKNAYRGMIAKKEKDNVAEVEGKATEKRTELLQSLPEEFKDHLTEVKDLLATTDDLQILDKEFDVVFLGNYVRGKKFTPGHIKSLEDAAYKRGVEQAKVLPKGGLTPKPNADKTKGGDLIKNITSEQKERAEDMYGRRDNWTKEQMWAAYMKDDAKDDF